MIGTDIEAHYQCTAADYVEAQIAHYRQTRGFYFLIIGGAIGILFGAFMVVRNGLGTGVPLLLLGAFWWSYFLIIPIWARRDFRKHPNLSREYLLHANEDGIQMKSDVSQGGGQWSVYTKYRETKSLFMLYCGARLFFMIPKRAFAHTQEQQFRELLRRKLPAAK